MTATACLPIRRPASEYGILETLAATDRFRHFIAAVAAAGMTRELARGNLTVFAPSDLAFERLPATERLALDQGGEPLRRLLRGHLVEGRYYERDLIPFTRLPTPAGTELHFLVGVSDGDIRVEGLGIVTTDILSLGGVVHEVDGVIR